MAETVTWEKIVELAKRVSEEPNDLSPEKIREHGISFDKYITSCSKESAYRDKAHWLRIEKGGKVYRVEETFYKRISRVLSKGMAKTPLTGDNATVLCYRISEMEKCSAEEVCDTFITLGLFPKKTMLKQKILDELKGDIMKKENSVSEHIEAEEFINQGGCDLPESDEDVVIRPEEYSEDTKNVQLNILQHTDRDNISEITEGHLKKFVTGFIGEMSYKIETFSPTENSRYSELFSICVDELSIFHQDIKPWEYVRVTYFASDISDEVVQQEIEQIHKLEKNPRSFVIVVCATDEIYRYVRKIIVCDSKKSIMLLCFEHQDEAYIYLKDKTKSDKKRFEFLKPSSKEYFYT